VVQGLVAQSLGLVVDSLGLADVVEAMSAVERRIHLRIAGSHTAKCGENRVVKKTWSIGQVTCKRCLKTV